MIGKAGDFVLGYLRTIRTVLIGKIHYFAEYNTKDNTDT